MFAVIAMAMAAWLVLALVAQISIKQLTHMRRWDPFGFIPSWHFFAPNPARFDTVIMTREVSQDPEHAAISEWSVAAVVYNEHLYHVLFNPTRRIQKSIHDLQNAIGNMSDNYDIEEICVSAPAKAMFQFAHRGLDTEDEGDGSKHRQFALVRISHARGEAEARVVFVTEPMKIAN